MQELILPLRKDPAGRLPVHPLKRLEILSVTWCRSALGIEALYTRNCLEPERGLRAVPPAAERPAHVHDYDSQEAGAPRQRGGH